MTEERFKAINRAFDRFPTKGEFVLIAAVMGLLAGVGFVKLLMWLL